MAYSDFTLRQVKQDFGLSTVEAGRFLPPVEPVSPSPVLGSWIAEHLAWALASACRRQIAVGTEKAKSEILIAPVLLEVKRILKQTISVFSGTEFVVNRALGLNGVCDFLVSRWRKPCGAISPEQFDIEAPVLAVVEAKRDNLNSGLGQCIAEMVAAQHFNQAQAQPIATIYGCITTGTAWRFLKLQAQTVTMDVQDYPLPPVEPLLGMLVWIAREG